MNQITPQAGYQETALISNADIVIGGGAAGSGKTYCLLMDFLYDIDNPKFGGVIFRRSYPQIRAEGGLWDTSLQLFPYVGGEPRESSMEWNFESGAKLKFSHLEYEKNKLDWQGAQIPFIGFDELTHFSESMFFYILSRNRSSCGVKPRVRCTCNPDPESWVSRLIEWWIDIETGYPIPERNGKLRYFIKSGSEYIWGDTKKEVYHKAKDIIDKAIETSKGVLKPENFIKSITFVSGSIYENSELLKVNPDYLSSLMALSESEKAALLEGNWKARIDDNDIYDFVKFKDIFTNSYVKQTGQKYITADIATKGSDLLVVYVWNGFVIIDVETCEKNSGKEAIELIEKLSKKHSVPQSNILFDADGVGSGLSGFIENAIEFHNGNKALNNENYKNLKTQCYYKSGERVNNAGIFILPEIANKTINGQPLKEHLINERKAIKRDKTDVEGKLCIIPKSEMIVKIGHSPDFLDAFAYREYFDLINNIINISELKKYTELPQNSIKYAYMITPNTTDEQFVIGIISVANNKVYIDNVIYLTDYIPESIIELIDRNNINKLVFETSKAGANNYKALKDSYTGKCDIIGKFPISNPEVIIIQNKKRIIDSFHFKNDNSKFITELTTDNNSQAIKLLGGLMLFYNSLQ